MKKISTAKPLPNLKALPFLALAVCIQLTAYSQQVKFGNSYVNLSKKQTGGTVQPGDTLEIRTCYYFAVGYGTSNNIYNARYVDNIPTNTTYIGDSLRLITNEGLTHKRWTNAAGDDPGTYLAAPPAGEYNIRINVGHTTTAPADNTPTSLTGAGNIVTGGASRDKPRVGGGMLITTAFKVRVTGAVGDTITLGAGQFLYQKTNGGVDTIVNAIQYKILISDNDPICPGAVGANFVAEAAGTFDSGFAQNRSYGPSFMIPSYNYMSNMGPAVALGDGNYALVNNLSPYASTYPNANKRPNCSGVVPSQDSCKNRMFNGYWDIIGDHTGTITSTGNPPSDTLAVGGYMLVVNADYATSEAYRQNITGLCPNTTYEFSLWVRNVCTNCGLDSNGTATYVPGVLPNLTFAIDDLDRYSTGQVDTLGWLKKGFLFKTGSAQTSITISIRNNASGGGGNDWAIDDISLVTCNPELDMVPSGNSNVCYMNAVDMSTLVSSFFDNYIYWTWEMSTDNGATWGSTGQSGTGSPVLNGGDYEYTAVYPTFLADSSQHMRQYRFKVGSSAANLSDPNCSFIASTTITVLVNSCSEVLKTSLLNFTGSISGAYGQLRWTTDNEVAGTKFMLERSFDGLHFEGIAELDGKAPAGFGTVYEYTDPHMLSGQTWYRLKISEGSESQYSKTVVLSTTGLFEVRSLVNPFRQSLRFELLSATAGNAQLYLLDSYGRMVWHGRKSLQNGINPISISGLETLSAGTYTLRIQMDNYVINKRVVKMAQ